MCQILLYSVTLTVTSVTLTTTQGGRYWYHLHFRNEETEAKHVVHQGQMANMYLRLIPELVLLTKTPYFLSLLMFLLSGT